MFRCTDCNKEYEVNPGYCDCGNDQFEEIVDYQNQQQYDNQYEYTDDYAQDQDGYNEYDNQQYDYDTQYDNQYNDQYNDQYAQYGQEYQQQEYENPLYQPRKKKKVSKKSKQSDIVCYIIAGICVVAAIVILFIPIGGGPDPDDNKIVGTDSSGKGTLTKDYSIPTSIDSLWDATQVQAPPSADKVNPNKILNTKLGSLDQGMNSYLIGLAQAMIDNWDRTAISGNGVTQMEFMIEKNGALVAKKIYKYSGNKSLDDSILKLISDFGQYQTPPSSYGQEIIIVSFSSKNGSMKAYYPNIKPE